MLPSRTKQTTNAQHQCSGSKPTILQGPEAFLAYVTFVSDPKYADLKLEELVSAVHEDSFHNLLFVVDRACLDDPEHPILVVEYGYSNGSFDSAKRGAPSDIKAFRALPATIQSIENNLTIGNMDFDEFADAVDSEGVFRGFPKTH